MGSVSSPKRLASVTRPAVIAVLVGLFLGGCASTCRTGRTGGWLSSLGQGGGRALPLRPHRAWGGGPDPTPGGSHRPPQSPPRPPAEPAPRPPPAPPRPAEADRA